MNDPDAQDRFAGVVSPMALEDLESLLQLCSDLKGLIRSDLLEPEDKLSAIDQALTIAVGGTMEAARDFVRDVVLGRLEP